MSDPFPSPSLAPPTLLTLYEGLFTFCAGLRGFLPKRRLKELTFKIPLVSKKSIRDYALCFDAFWTERTTAVPREPERGKNLIIFQKRKIKRRGGKRRSGHFSFLFQKRYEGYLWSGGSQKKPPTEGRSSFSILFCSSFSSSSSNSSFDASFSISPEKRISLSLLFRPIDGRAARERDARTKNLI